MDGTFWQATQPVSGTVTANAGTGTMATDPTDDATRELGRTRLWDGTDEATILAARSAPATTEKALATVRLPSRKPGFQVVTAEVAPAITIGVKELLNLWSAAAVAQDIYIVEIVVSILVTTASTTGGRTNVEVLRSTSAPTGGTALTPGPLDVGSAAGGSAITNATQVKTGGGALSTAFIRQGVEHATMPLGNNRIPIFQASSHEEGLLLKGGIDAGLNIQVNRVVAHTALVDQWTASVRWIEL